MGKQCTEGSSCTEQHRQADRQTDRQTDTDIYRIYTFIALGFLAMSNEDGVTIVTPMYSAIIFIKSLPLCQTAWADMMTVQKSCDRKSVSFYN
jgi:hypothetical protein